MTDVIIKRVDEVYCKVISDASVARELSESFTFTVPGAKFMASVRNKFWDGKIRLFNLANRTIYAGLASKIIKFCEQRDYTYEIDPDMNVRFAVDEEYLNDLLNEIRAKYEPRFYQREAFLHAVNNNRAVLLSPTGSGKSFIIYLLTRHYNLENKRVLIVVPTTSLVYQMKTDFEDYNDDRKLDIHTIMGGADKDVLANITISTWQSIFKLDKEWFDKFDVVIGDEAHQFKAKSLTDIMSKLTDCAHRFGFTGTLDESLTNEMVLEGLFGPVTKVITTKELMDDKHLAQLKINAIQLNYSDAEKKIVKGKAYIDEMDYIVRHPGRNNFIKNLCTNIDGNTLVLFQYVEKHGKILYDMIKSAVNEDRKVFFIHGGVDGEEREEYRSIVEGETNAIIIASYGTYSTGINIKNLHNVIFASPTKSKIRNLQSIGRGLRTADGKNEARLYDLFDDFRNKSYVNHTMKHFVARAKIYDEEKFEYKIIPVQID